MTEDAHGSTTVIEKYAPGLAWLPRWMRGNFTPKVAWTIAVVICSGAITLATKVIAHEIRVGMRDARLDQVEADAQEFKKSLAETKQALSRMEGVLAGISMKAEAFGKFQSDVQTGAKEALATHVPKLVINKGRRANKHPP